MDSLAAQEISESYPISFTDQITFADLKDVIDGKIAAIHIKEFSSKMVCQIASERILN
ncbi:MAG TPA: hypothetical protein VLH77_03625 [Gammaproteobacteria bacterium]|nr:hypothetical protein [Gammaproteobacteria bacterium]